MNNHPGFVVFEAKHGNTAREGFVGRIAAPPNKDKCTSYCLQLAGDTQDVAPLVKVVRLTTASVAHSGANSVLLISNDGSDGGTLTQFEFMLKAKEAWLHIQTDKTRLRLAVDQPTVLKIFAMFAVDNPWIAKTVALE
jgi:hypothetical protein